MKSDVAIDDGSARVVVTITLETKKEIAAFLALAQSLTKPAICSSIATCAPGVTTADDVATLIDQLVTQEQFIDICDKIRR